MYKLKEIFFSVCLKNYKKEIFQIIKKKKIGKMRSFLHVQFLYQYECFLIKYEETRRLLAIDHRCHNLLCQ